VQQTVSKASIYWYVIACFLIVCRSSFFSTEASAMKVRSVNVQAGKINFRL
jgi:hypothetical protein